MCLGQIRPVYKCLYVGKEVISTCFSYEVLGKKINIILYIYILTWVCMCYHKKRFWNRVLTEVEHTVYQRYFWNSKMCDMFTYLIMFHFVSMRFIHYKTKLSEQGATQIWVMIFTKCFRKSQTRGNMCAVDGKTTQRLTFSVF